MIKMVSSQLVKGFADFSGVDASKRLRVVQIIQDTFLRYGFEPAETPIIESEDFVVGDNASDDAVRDVYRLSDRADRKLALRYEFTFQLQRLARNKKLPYKRFQIGYNFRDEPVRKGRLRQFIQCDADVVGSGPFNEAENLSLLGEVFSLLGIDATVYVNSRRLLDEILESEGIIEHKRDQVLREIDKLGKLSRKDVADNLKVLGAESVLKVFTQKEEFFEKYARYVEIRDLKAKCESFGLEVVFDPTLSRGLSYYNGMVFEAKSKDLNVSIAGGGSYMVGKAQATGISLGLEPIFLLSSVGPVLPDVVMISLGEDDVAISLTRDLRSEGFSVDLLSDKSLRKGLEYVNTRGVRFAVIVGKKEVEQKKFVLKDMQSGKESLCSVSELVNSLKV